MKRFEWVCWWHFNLGWFPIQPCFAACGRWYWGGFPVGKWRASYQEYCCKKCHDECEVFMVDED
jgi:hypothetical protein